MMEAFWSFVLSFVKWYIGGCLLVGTYEGVGKAVRAHQRAKFSLVSATLYGVVVSAICTAELALLVPLLMIPEAWWPSCLRTGA
jgi:hypothetical protein